MSIYNELGYDPVKLAQQNNAWNARQAQYQRDQERSLFYAGNAFNASEAAKNREWQQMMSDTAHQREIRDLQAAGLNPVLSASGGNGASVTSGATASSLSAPSMSKADADTSANAALASLYNASLQYKAQLHQIDTNARTNLAIANTQADASRYGSDRAAAASMYNSALSSATSKEINSRQLENAMKLAQYDFEKQMEYRGFDRETQRQMLESQQFHDEYMKLMYPQNVWQAAAGLGSKYGKLNNTNFFVDTLFDKIIRLFQKNKYRGTPAY